MTGQVEFHEPFELCRESQAAPAFGLEDCLHNLPNAPLIQKPVQETKSEQTLGFTQDLFGRFHHVHPALVSSSGG
jgi:hypothetical protein